MKFCDFLKILYQNKNNNITTQDDYVVQMFNSTGVTFSYSEGYGKKLLSGKKPLSQDIRELVGENFNFDNLMSFFYNNEKETSLSDFFFKFNIANDIEKNFAILCLCFVSQFILFIKEGNEVNNIISNMYEIYLDEVLGKNKPDNNKDALLISKGFIYNAIESLSSLSPDSSLLRCGSHFESFFSAIKSAHYSFTRNANFKARQIYRAFCKGAYDINQPKDKFLYNASIQSYESMKFIKKLNYIVYNDLISKDKFDTIEITIFDESEEEKKIEILNKLISKEQNVAYFSEFISFQISGTDNNLLEDYYYILLKTIKTFEFLEDEIGTTESIQYLNKKISKIFNDLRLEFIHYISDGIYHKENNFIEYANSIEPLFGTDDENMHIAGDKLFKIDNSFFNNLKNINEKMEYIFKLYSLLLKEGKMNSESMMLEIYTFNQNGTYRLYLIPATCKAKIYRFVRKICSRMINDETTSFFSIGISVYKSSNSKESVFKDALCAFAYENSNVYSLFLPIENIIKNDICEVSKGNYMNPIFTPIIALINAYKKKAHHN